jgi:membrane-associated phospholipid phosphatase
VVVALTGFALLFLLAAPRDPPSWEADVVDAAVEIPDVVGAPMRLVMQLGRRSLVPAIALAIYLVGRRVRPPVAVVAAGLVTAQTVNVLKELASRPRPSGVRVREAADGFGFPSGHSAMAWTLAVVIATQLPPRWRWVPYAVAATVAVTRMHVGVHYPLDVVGGALWGLAVGGIVVVAANLRPTRQPEHH